MLSLRNIGVKGESVKKQNTRMRKGMTLLIAVGTLTFLAPLTRAQDGASTTAPDVERGLGHVVVLYRRTDKQGRVIRQDNAVYDFKKRTVTIVRTDYDAFQDTYHIILLGTTAY